MAFISVADEIARKSFTNVENKFITKYMPVLEPVAVKVYLYSVYLSQCGREYSLFDLANSLNLSEDELKENFRYLEEFELVAITSQSPFEVKICDAENVYGTPKKFKPEKYSEFTKSVQNIIKGRMISTNEFREYFYLLEEYGFEQNALLMIINYCVNLKGDDIRLQYIKKVAKSFADEGVTTAAKVDEKLSSYTSSTPSLIRIFNAVGIKGKPDVDDDKAFKKWTDELGFDEQAIICAAKLFKAKSCERVDEALCELYKNKKFDPKEIEDYCKNRTSLFEATKEIARNLGIYMSNSAPYVENYVSVWCNMGYSLESLKTLSFYCFKRNKNSFEDMSDFVKKLYDEGVICDEAVKEKLDAAERDDGFLKEVLSRCGLSRRVTEWDRDCLKRWRGWEFSDRMIFEAAGEARGKNNPVAYMNAVLSAWKNQGVTTPEGIPSAPLSATRSAGESAEAERQKILIERHYYDLRHRAQEKAEAAAAKAAADPEYSRLRDEIGKISMELGIAEFKSPEKVGVLTEKLSNLESLSEKRLKELNLKKDDLSPEYSCKICNDTGYDEHGKPCVCMLEFIKTL